MGDIGSENGEPIRVSTLGMRLRDNLISELQKMPIEVRNANSTHEEALTKLVGPKVLPLIKNRGLDLLICSTAGLTDYYGIKYKGKVLLIEDMSEFSANPEGKMISTSFLTEKGFEILLKREWAGRGQAFDEVANKMQGEPLEFLRFAADVLMAVDNNCQIQLEPATKKRERLYRTFFDKHNMTNLTIVHAREDDIKKPKL